MDCVTLDVLYPADAMMEQSALLAHKYASLCIFRLFTLNYSSVGLCTFPLMGTSDCVEGKHLEAVCAQLYMGKPCSLIRKGLIILLRSMDP